MPGVATTLATIAAAALTTSPTLTPAGLPEPDRCGANNPAVSHAHQERNSPDIDQVFAAARILVGTVSGLAQPDTVVGAVAAVAREWRFHVHDVGGPVGAATSVTDAPAHPPSRVAGQPHHGDPRNALHRGADPAELGEGPADPNMPGEIGDQDEPATVRSGHGAEPGTDTAGGASSSSSDCEPGGAHEAVDESDEASHGGSADQAASGVAESPGAANHEPNSSGADSTGGTESDCEAGTGEPGTSDSSGDVNPPGEAGSTPDATPDATAGPGTASGTASDTASEMAGDSGSTAWEPQLQDLVALLAATTDPEAVELAQRLADLGYGVPHVGAPGARDQRSETGTGGTNPNAETGGLGDTSPTDTAQTSGACGTTASAWEPAAQALAEALAGAGEDPTAAALVECLMAAGFDVSTETTATGTTATGTTVTGASDSGRPEDDQAGEDHADDDRGGGAMDGGHACPAADQASAR